VAEAKDLSLGMHFGAGTDSPPTMRKATRCPQCGQPAHVATISWSAETFGTLQCDGRAITGVADLRDGARGVHDC
jgi:hypothetical protein